MNASARWVVYMSVDDGAILISQPEDAPPFSDLGSLDPRRIAHVIGRGANEAEAAADARRQLGRPR